MARLRPTPSRCPSGLLWAKDLDEQLPQQLDWAGYDEFGGADGSSPGTATPSPPRRLACTVRRPGVSQRWTNKFSEVGIETVGDLVGKSEEDCCASMASVPRRSRSP
ncbi:MAG: hypothetical protein ACLRM9_01665 [Collinsella aerofaciens]